MSKRDSENMKHYSDKETRTLRKQLGSSYVRWRSFSFPLTSRFSVKLSLSSDRSHPSARRPRQYRLSFNAANITCL